MKSPYIEWILFIPPDRSLDLHYPENTPSSSLAGLAAIKSVFKAPRKRILTLKIRLSFSVFLLGELLRIQSPEKDSCTAMRIKRLRQDSRAQTGVEPTKYRNQRGQWESELESEKVSGNA